MAVHVGILRRESSPERWPAQVIQRPRSGYSRLEPWIARQGYCISHVGARSGNVYLYAAMEQKLRFSNGLRSIEVVVSKTEATCHRYFNSTAQL